MSGCRGSGRGPGRSALDSPPDGRRMRRPAALSARRWQPLAAAGLVAVPGPRGGPARDGGVSRAAAPRRGRPWYDMPMASYEVERYEVRPVEGDDQIEVVIHASDGSKWEYG